MASTRLQFKQHAYIWKEVFTRVDGDASQYDSENYRKAQLPQHSLVDGQRVVSLIDPHPSTEDVIDRFVHNDCQQNIDRFLYRRILLHFLEQATMQSLRQESSPPSLRQIALLDDRNPGSAASVGIHDRNAGLVTYPSGVSRQSNGPLTAYHLYKELCKNRVALPDSPDAYRRAIYVTNIESLCALAFAATVSPSQASFLRDFIYNHLAFETTLGVHIPSIGYPTFCLEFHFPYYAWRRVIADENGRFPIRIDDRHLRSSDEVIRFQRCKPGLPQPRNHKDYIYEAQVSVMITGRDDRFWTSYCFVDLYFENEGHNEQVHQLSNVDLPMDPNSCGIDSLDRPIWNPRHYLLRTLSCRMGQLKQEWSNTIFQLRQEIDPCIDAFKRHEEDDERPSSMKFIDQAEFNWSRRTLRQFTHLISKTIDAWETFKDGEIQYFDLPDSEADPRAPWWTLVADIDKDVTELKKLRGSLLYRTELFETMTTSILTHATHAESMITRLQSQFVQALTVITISYLPPTLASAVFSMQSQVISEPQFKHWVYTVVGLFIATAFLVATVSVANYVDTPKVSRSIAKWLMQILGALFRRTELGIVNWKWRWTNRDDTSSDETELDSRNRSSRESTSGEV